MGYIAPNNTFLLELEGKLAGRFFELSGGMPYADVIVEGAGRGLTGHKHLGAVRFQDMQLSCSAGMSRTFYDWIGAFGRASMRKSGAVITLDQASKPAVRLDFYDALVKSLVLPSLDRSASGHAAMKVAISPERTSFNKSGGTQNLGVYTSLPKASNIGSFRIQIDGLSADCSHVTRISSLTLGQKIAQDPGGSGVPDLIPGATEYSDLTVELPGSNAVGFYKWLDDFVVKGNSSLEKNGSIDFLGSGSSSPYFSVKLSGLGIYKSSASGGPAKTPHPVAFNMYCEEMTFSAGAAALK
jgi:hypothetical protein